ncbi:MAG TPA: diacylglycerol kinase family protein [Streptosporangiaceae bacterium]|nr:diacylglycerol kinase family protein [Streptosporangiaceae bacterium]
MRALLIFNPQATSTSRLRLDVLVRALASEIELEVVETRYRGHAATLASDAAREGLDLVVTLGGDGTVNETVNGLMNSPVAGSPGLSRGLAGVTAHGDTADKLPALASIPGGNGNVFIRSLGLPADPIDATGHILAGLSSGRTRSIGLGLAGGRYFTFSAGLGIDAEVVRAIEGLRASGRKASDALYVWLTIRQYYSITDRKCPALTLERPGRPPVSDVFLGVVSNTSPWTYVGNHPVNPSPLASFDTGLDVFALRRLRTVSTMRVLGQMFSDGRKLTKGRYVLNLHDESELTLRSSRPIAMQVDGEYMGERECVAFRSVPRALRVVV